MAKAQKKSKVGVDSPEKLGKKVQVIGGARVDLNSPDLQDAKSLADISALEIFSHLPEDQRAHHEGVLAGLLGIEVQENTENSEKEGDADSND